MLRAEHESMAAPCMLDVDIVLVLVNHFDSKVGKAKRVISVAVSATGVTPATMITQKIRVTMPFGHIDNAGHRWLPVRAIPKSIIPRPGFHATMDQVEQLAESSNLTFQKIGRNVFALQQMEGLLKFLVSISDLSSPASNLPEHLQQRIDSVSKKPMGPVVGEYIDILFAEASAPELPEDQAEPWVAHRYRPGGGKARRDELTAMVKERNDLIHHRLLSFNPCSEESCRALNEFLDDQFRRLQPVWSRLHSERSDVINTWKLLEEIQNQIKDDDARANPIAP